MFNFTEQLKIKITKKFNYLLFTYLISRRQMTQDYPVWVRIKELSTTARIMNEFTTILGAIYQHMSIF